MQPSKSYVEGHLLQATNLLKYFFLTQRIFLNEYRILGKLVINTLLDSTDTSLSTILNKTLKKTGKNFNKNKEHCQPY